MICFVGVWCNLADCRFGCLRICLFECGFCVRNISGLLCSCEGLQDCLGGYDVVGWLACFGGLFSGCGCGCRVVVVLFW